MKRHQTLRFRYVADLRCRETAHQIISLFLLMNRTRQGQANTSLEGVDGF